MRVVVTGAAGFLGTNLINVLVNDGHEVCAVEHGTANGATHDSRGVSWVTGDVLDAGRMREIFTDAEVVYHLAARITLKQEHPDAWHLNTVGPRTVAEAALAAGVRRMVHCSSVHSFDTAKGGEIDEASARSTSPKLPVYDRSKWRGEQNLREVIDNGMDIVIANPTGIIGPIDHPDRLSRVNGMLRDAARGKVPIDIRGGFDWVDARDVARGLIQVADHGRTGENYLLGGNFLSIHDAFTMAANMVGRRPPAFALPLWVMAAILPIAEPIGRRLGSDVMSEASLASLRSSPAVNHGKAASELGYTARPAEETIRDLIMWFIEQGVLDRRRMR